MAVPEGENPFHNDEAETQTEASSSSLYNVYSHTQEDDVMEIEEQGQEEEEVNFVRNLWEFSDNV